MNNTEDEIPDEFLLREREKQTIYGKNEALMLSGFAILLMIWHHFFNFPEWYKEGVEWQSATGQFGKIFTEIFASIGGICVPIFAIKSGYAFTIKKEKYSSLKKRFSILLRFLVHYWLICGLYLLVGFYNDSNDLPDKGIFMLNLFGLETGARDYLNVTFAWYVSFYIALILTMPFLAFLFNGKKIKHDLLAITGISGIIMLLLGLPVSQIVHDYFVLFIPFFSVCIGILMAKHSIFDRVHERFLKSVYSLIIALTVFAIIYLRYLFKFYEADNLILNIGFKIFNAVLPTLLVILLIESFHRIKSRFFRKTLMFFGSISMFLWFLHGIFFSGSKFMQEELFQLKEPLLIFIVTLLILTPIAFVLLKLNNCLTKSRRFAMGLKSNV